MTIIILTHLTRGLSSGHQFAAWSSRCNYHVYAVTLLSPTSRVTFDLITSIMRRSKRTTDDAAIDCHVLKFRLIALSYLKKNHGGCGKRWKKKRRRRRTLSCFVIWSQSPERGAEWLSFLFDQKQIDSYIRAGEAQQTRATPLPGTAVEKGLVEIFLPRGEKEKVVANDD